MIALSGSALSRETYRIRLLFDLAGMAYEYSDAPDLIILAYGERFEDAWRALSRLAPPDWQAHGRWFAIARRLASSPAETALFRELDQHLWFGEREGQNFLGSDHPTVADIGCFPEVVMSDQVGVSLLPYPALRRWTDRMRQLPGFSTMPGTFELPA
jgi:glutathione S-transferase